MKLVKTLHITALALCTFIGCATANSAVTIVLTIVSILLVVSYIENDNKEQNKTANK